MTDIEYTRDLIARLSSMLLEMCDLPPDRRPRAYIHIIERALDDAIKMLWDMKVG